MNYKPINLLFLLAFGCFLLFSKAFACDDNAKRTQDTNLYPKPTSSIAEILPPEILKNEIGPCLDVEALSHFSVTSRDFEKHSEKIFEKRAIQIQGSLLPSDFKQPNKFSYIARKFLKEGMFIYFQENLSEEEKKKLNKIHKFFKSFHFFFEDLLEAKKLKIYQPEHLEKIKDLVSKFEDRYQELSNYDNSLPQETWFIYELIENDPNEIGIAHIYELNKIPESCRDIAYYFTPKNIDKDEFDVSRISDMTRGFSVKNPKFGIKFALFILSIDKLFYQNSSIEQNQTFYLDLVESYHCAKNYKKVIEIYEQFKLCDKESYFYEDSLMKVGKIQKALDLYESRLINKEKKDKLELKEVPKAPPKGYYNGVYDGVMYYINCLCKAERYQDVISICEQVKSEKQVLIKSAKSNYAYCLSKIGKYLDAIDV